MNLPQRGIFHHGKLIGGPAISSNYSFNSNRTPSYFEIEKILSHRIIDKRLAKIGGKCKRRASDLKIEYLVKWRGFDEPSWQSEKNLSSEVELISRYKSNIKTMIIGEAPVPTTPAPTYRFDRQPCKCNRSKKCHNSKMDRPLAKNQDNTNSITVSHTNTNTRTNTNTNTNTKTNTKTEDNVERDDCLSEYSECECECGGGCDCLEGFDFRNVFPVKQQLNLSKIFQPKKEIDVDQCTKKQETVAEQKEKNQNQNQNQNKSHNQSESKENELPQIKQEKDIIKIQDDDAAFWNSILQSNPTTDDLPESYCRPVQQKDENDDPTVADPTKLSQTNTSKEEGQADKKGQHIEDGEDQIVNIIIEKSLARREKLDDFQKVLGEKSRKRKHHQIITIDLDN